MIYHQAIDAYENGNYEEAKRLFHSVPEFGDSENYLRLIRIRGYGENVGMGSAYNHSKRLTEEEKEDIDKAAENFDFADTAEVLLCKTDVACYYLMGRWTSPAGSQHSAYFIMEKHSNGGYQYRRNMDNYKSDSFSINDGIIRVSITSSNTKAFHLSLLGPDELYAYNYKDEEVYILYRNA